MIRSMTGYGRAQQKIGPRDITVEIKSVNHRYFEFSSKTPRNCGYLEERLKTYLQEQVARGKVEANVFMQVTEGDATEVELNRDLAAAYVNALRSVTELDLRDDLTLSSLARFPDIFTVRRQQENEDEVWQAVKTVADEALGKFVSMREAEGQRLTEDILSRLAEVEKLVGLVEERSPQTVEAYRERLAAKIQEVLADRQIDETRIITEAAIFADRVAVDEETVRLHSHIAQFKEILESGGCVGRKLDFLVQELNREANTIGSKAQDAQMARIVVALKSNIEKIREQIQNLE
ncbi:MAG: YicC family protein [Oscillospiraceae bacterium]|nr:YicC family protein [Oscillospiraceae bacterium]MCI9362671.1 YicC family protein [Oscillospiraceae bacterium]RKJ57951.1 YicC family protein [bacterium 1XD42-8]RKJ66752.1 YicC family protein [bacterium 1XD42-1]